MRYKIIILFIASFAGHSSFSQTQQQYSAKSVKAYIKRIGLDSISKGDLFKEKVIQFTQEEVKITQADVYFDHGESFKSVQMQTFAGNALRFLNVHSIINAKPPFRITIADIHYITKNGMRGIADEFSFIVY